MAETIVRDWHHDGVAESSITMPRIDPTKEVKDSTMLTTSNTGSWSKLVRKAVRKKGHQIDNYLLPGFSKCHALDQQSPSPMQPGLHELLRIPQLLMIGLHS
mmetsp:Transcript_43005/g.85172  ORF Transcript_43005/g.85172 Transcript_43005/m.85172 type:complete len:102 (+) Transcript_43005:82-387(+)